MPALQNIAQLSDDDLREQLKNYGVNAGPIVSATRHFYEEKLGKLIDSKGEPQSETESEEEDNEDHEEDEEVQINYNEPASKPKKSSGWGLGMLIKLLLIGIVAALICLVIRYMNPSAQYKIPNSLDGSGV